MMVYDITDRESFKDINYWMQEVSKYKYIKHIWTDMRSKMLIKSLWAINAI
jgi:hypothetical protein